MQLKRKSVKCQVCLHEAKTLLRDTQTTYRCLSCQRMVRVLSPLEVPSLEEEMILQGIVEEAPKKKRGRKPKNERV